MAFKNYNIPCNNLWEDYCYIKVTSSCNAASIIKANLGTVLKCKNALFNSEKKSIRVRMDQDRNICPS